MKNESSRKRIDASTRRRGENRPLTDLNSSASRNTDSVSRKD